MSRQIAVVLAEITAESGYEGLHQAFRAQAERLNLSRDQIDELATLTRGHASKLLAPYPIRAIGRTTLGPMLYALKAKLLFVPDETIEWSEEPNDRDASQARAGKPLDRGSANLPEMRSISRKVITEAMRKNGRKGGLKSAKARARLSHEQRSRIAKRAARTRLRNQREKRAAGRNAPQSVSALRP